MDDSPWGHKESDMTEATELSTAAPRLKELPEVDRQGHGRGLHT